MSRPDFFLAGAPKCGTTALYAMLGAHPEIFVSAMKEPDYFASDIRAAVPALKGRAIDNWLRYQQLFDHASPDQQAGEGSVSYLASRVAASAIHESCPDARIIAILRDPANRLFSHYRAALATRATRTTFLDWLAIEVQEERRSHAPIGPVVAGRYGANLQRYFDVFPASAIHVMWYDDFVKDPAAAVRGVFAFLGVDPACRVPVSLRRNETRVSRLPAFAGVSALIRLFPQSSRRQLRRWATRPDTTRMTSGDHAAAIDLYRDDLRTLATLTGRDLQRWINPTR